MPEEVPLFASIFGEAWERLPPVMREHYAVCAGSGDMVVAEGALDVKGSLLARLLGPFLRLFGALVPYDGVAVPVTVRFMSPPKTRAFVFDRLFHFPGRAPCRFRSRMEQIAGNEVVEFMRFGVGWRLRYGWDGGRVRLAHIGYVWRVFGRLVPLPLELFMGRCDAWEEPVDEHRFRMHMECVHARFGHTYSYGGVFRLGGAAHE